MQKFLQRRLADGVFFVILMVLFGGLALVLHIDAIHRTDPAHHIYQAYILQAQVWLQGHLDLGVKLNDTIIINNKVYINYPPLPSLLMVPFVAVMGDKFSDVWFTWAFAALNMILLYRTLEVMRVRHITTRTALENRIIALTFGFGTIALWICVGASLPFTGQTISIFGIMFTLHSTLSRRWPLATLGVGMVLLTRSSESLIGLVPLIVYLHDLGIGRDSQGHWRLLPQRWPSLRELVVTLTPFVGAVIIFLVHNKLYFGNLLSTGYDIQNQQHYPEIKYGLLNWHYIWPNVVVDFLRWPSFPFTGINDVHPHPDLFIDGFGTSMLFSTPLLAVFLFDGQGKTAQPWLRNTFWVASAVMLLSVLLYCAEGWVQVGARYVFELYPLLFLLLAQRAPRLDARWISLAGLSIFINLLLAQTFWERRLSHLFEAGSAGIVVIGCIIALFLLHRDGQEHEATMQMITPVSD